MSPDDQECTRTCEQERDGCERGRHRTQLVGGATGQLTQSSGYGLGFCGTPAAQQPKESEGETWHTKFLVQYVLLAENDGYPMYPTRDEQHTCGTA